MSATSGRAIHSCTAQTCTAMASRSRYSRMVASIRTIRARFTIPYVRTPDACTTATGRTSTQLLPSAPAPANPLAPVGSIPPATPPGPASPPATPPVPVETAPPATPPALANPPTTPTVPIAEPPPVPANSPTTPPVPEVGTPPNDDDNPSADGLVNPAGIDLWKFPRVNFYQND
jgi:hypothetical protein